MLIYVGIQMVIRSASQAQAKYKEMLTDWVVSLALLFLLHYIIIFVININSTLVNGFAKIASNASYFIGDVNAGITLGKAFDTELQKSIWFSGFGGMIAAFIWVMIKGMTFMYFVFYVKRMVTVGFLIMIAPLITITYALDKMGDGKAQAFNTWLKEFVYNILIQPFHCIIYLAFFGALTEMFKEGGLGKLGVYVLAWTVYKFMFDAEKLLRKIFNFQTNSSDLSQTSQGIMNATKTFAKGSMAVGAGLAKFHAAGGVKGLVDKNMEGIRNIGLQGKARKQAKNDALASVKDDFMKDIEQRERKSFIQNEFKKGKGTIRAVDRKANADKKFKDYQDKEFEKYKQTKSYKQKVKENAKNMQPKKVKELKEQADKDRKAKREKEREAVAEKMYDKKNGRGEYQKLKINADSGDTRAQNELKGVREQAQKRIDNGMGLHKNPAKMIGGAVGNIDKFVSKAMDNEILSSSVKVAAGIVGAGIIGGAGGGNFQSMYTGWQVGSGYMNGRLNATGKELAKDGAQSTKEYMKATGETDPAEALAQIILDGKAGELDKMSDFEDKIKRELKALGATNNAEIKQLIAALKHDIVNGNDVDIENLINTHIKTRDPSQNRDVLNANLGEKLNEFNIKYNASIVWQSYQKAEKCKIDQDDHTNFITREMDKMD